MSLFTCTVLLEASRRCCTSLQCHAVIFLRVIVDPRPARLGVADDDAAGIHRFEHDQAQRRRDLGDAELARVNCPIGLPGITGKEPAVIAASVVAQLLLVRSGAAKG